MLIASWAEPAPQLQRPTVGGLSTDFLFIHSASAIRLNTPATSLQPARTPRQDCPNSRRRLVAVQHHEELAASLYGLADQPASLVRAFLGFVVRARFAGINDAEVDMRPLPDMGADAQRGQVCQLRVRRCAFLAAEHPYAGSGRPEGRGLWATGRRGSNAVLPRETCMGRRLRPVLCRRPSR